MRDVTLLISFVFYALLSASPYALLVLFAIKTWRRLQPELSFKAQLPSLAWSFPLYLIGWGVLAYVGLSPVMALFAFAPPEQQQFANALLFVPLLPLYTGFLLAAGFDALLSLVGLDIESMMCVIVPLVVVGTALSAILILLLISFAEWLIVRALYRRTAKLGPSSRITSE